MDLVRLNEKRKLHLLYISYIYIIFKITQHNYTTTHVNGFHGCYSGHQHKIFVWALLCIYS